MNLYICVLIMINLKKKNDNKTNEDFWYPLDNAAKIYPAIQSKELTTVFRISAILKERVKIAHIISIIPALEERFPYFKVTLRKGFFWYYLEHLNVPISVEVDNDMACREFNKKDKNKLLFRILILNNRISVEFSHILTDGNGAYIFLNYLLKLYFRHEGLDVIKNLNDQIMDSEILKEESEDSYNKYFKEKIPPNLKQPKAFHLPYKLNSIPRFDVLIAILPIDEIKKKALGKGVSITVYLIALYLFILQEVHESLSKYSRFKKNKILRIQVPINLRNIYRSNTMRNFTLFVMPEIDMRLGNYTLDEIIKIVYHKMQLETEEKIINKIISRNVGSERKLFIRGIPLFIKGMILYFKYYSMGTNQYSGVITNLGKTSFSKEIDRKIDYMVFTPPPPNKKLKLNCGIIGFDNKLVLSFGNITKSREFEKKFINFLIQEGIQIKLSNY